LTTRAIAPGSCFTWEGNQKRRNILPRTFKRSD
jgi:hypothetical protein